jgi:hypothetical protein
VYEAKTKPTDVDVASFLAGVDDDSRRADCQALAELMARVTGCAATMWGPSIVGFDRYHYQYASGHEGESCVVGFSPRKTEISVYLMSGFDSDQARSLLAELGRHRLGKACLYLRRLSDIQSPVLEALIRHAVAEIKRRYPG